MKSSITLLVILALFNVSCNLFESTSPGQTTSCRTEGTVKDFTGLDGCGLLIVKPDGTKLIPLSVPDNFILKDGQKIVFDYVEEPMVNICMAGPTVKITCIKEVPAGSGKCDQNGTFEVASELAFSMAKNSAFTFFGSSYANGKLTLDIGYSGCSPTRDFKLLGSPAIMKSLPPQRAVKFTFQEQLCEAWFRQKLCFDVSAINEKMVLILTDSKGQHKITVGD